MPGADGAGGAAAGGSGGARRRRVPAGVPRLGGQADRARTASCATSAMRSATPATAALSPAADGGWRRTRTRWCGEAARGRCGGWRRLRQLSALQVGAGERREVAVGAPRSGASQAAGRAGPCRRSRRCAAPVSNSASGRSGARRERALAPRRAPPAGSPVAQRRRRGARAPARRPGSAAISASSAVAGGRPVALGAAAARASEQRRSASAAVELVGVGERLARARSGRSAASHCRAASARTTARASAGIARLGLVPTAVEELGGGGVGAHRRERRGLAEPRRRRRRRGAARSPPPRARRPGRRRRRRRTPRRSGSRRGRPGRRRGRRARRSQRMAGPPAAGPAMSRPGASDARPWLLGGGAGRKPAAAGGDRHHPLGRARRGDARGRGRADRLGRRARRSTPAIAAAEPSAGLAAAGRRRRPGAGPARRRRWRRRRRAGSATSRPPASMATGRAAGSTRTSALAAGARRAAAGGWRRSAAWRATGLPVRDLPARRDLRTRAQRPRPAARRAGAAGGQAGAGVQPHPRRRRRRGRWRRRWRGRRRGASTTSPTTSRRRREDVIAFAAGLLGMPAPPRGRASRTPELTPMARSFWDEVEAGRRTGGSARSSGVDARAGPTIGRACAASSPPAAEGRGATAWRKSRRGPRFGLAFAGRYRPRIRQSRDKAPGWGH